MADAGVSKPRGPTDRAVLLLAEAEIMAVLPGLKDLIERSDAVAGR